MLSLICLLVLPFCWMSVVDGQGRMLVPAGRGSLWRVGYDTPVNHNDNLLSCGGVKHRWQVNNGKCGICGDSWDSKIRDHETGGKYASGIITRAYISGSIVEVTLEIAIPNGGYFEFRVCAQNSSKKLLHKCFSKGILTIGDSQETQFKNITDGLNKVLIKLPEGLTCTHCVLQWKYRTAEHFGCDVTETGEICGFGRGIIQTEYFACADIAIFNKGEFNDLVKYNFDPINHNFNNLKNRKSDREMRNVTLFSGMSYQADNSSGTNYADRDVNFKPLSHTNWQLDEQHRHDRIRRRTHGSHHKDVSIGNPHLQGIQGLGNENLVGIRTNFNIRQGGLMWSNGLGTLLNGLGAGGKPVLIEMDPRGVSANENTVANPPQPQTDTVVPKMKSAVNVPNFSTGRGSGSAPLIRQIDTTHVLNTFLKPFDHNLQTGTSVNTGTQKNLSINPRPTKSCKHCPFDQCLDNKMQLSTLFPGLFDNPSTFFECKKYDQRIFSVGRFDILKEGLPDCRHPRFRRQLASFEDDDMGCCGTRPQVILPLTVDADNDSFSVVQLDNDKKQFIVQGICGKDNTSSCTVCAAENNFQWVLVYDPRVNTVPPVSFVPVKFPHYCRCYNYGPKRGRR